ncbi:hypothetical protein M514_23486 [Trichuris suis]|uniref:Uncharacterized protein n=1 Tax=Trichuris suis TaxID=68888 RepID=A0A085N4C2_9BILA|nr:hypothetical protein M514_23486 [Trichuris suis]
MDDGKVMWKRWKYGKRLFRQNSLKDENDIHGEYWCCESFDMPALSGTRSYEPRDVNRLLQERNKNKPSRKSVHAIRCSHCLYEDEYRSICTFLAHQNQTPLVNSSRSPSRPHS